MDSKGNESSAASAPAASPQNAASAPAVKRAVDVVAPPAARPAAPKPIEMSSKDVSSRQAAIPAKESNPTAQSTKSQKTTTTPNAKPSKTEEKPSGESVAKLKQPRTVPLGAVIGAVFVFLVLAVVAYMAYRKG